jgi:hypothetical protein
MAQLAASLVDPERQTVVDTLTRYPGDLDHVLAMLRALHRYTELRQGGTLHLPPLAGTL